MESSDPTSLSTSHSPSFIVLLICWLALVLLSVATVTLGDSGSSHLLAGGILLVALAKAWIIIDGFMELRRTRGFWRPLLLAWPLVMAAVIGFGLLSRT